MNNKCIYLKQKLNRKVVCKLDQNKTIPKDCIGCNLKNKSSLNGKFTSLNGNFKQTKLRNKSKKLIKIEKERFSLFSTNNNKCYFCPSTYKLTWHEIYRGRNRSNSMKYGLCLRMCLHCHEKYQEDKSFNDKWHKKGQVTFNKTYPNLDFIDIFKINYLD